MLASLVCVAPPGSPADVCQHITQPVQQSQTSDDPVVGAVVTAFVAQDPENPNDSYDILTGWRSAVDELHSINATEVSFAVYRQAFQGALSGGPSVSTVAQAVEYANEHDLSVTILPLFETDQGWRGNYDPVGQERFVFQSEYTQWIQELAAIEGVDRFNIGSELNALVGNTDNAGFLQDLLQTTRQTLDASGNTATRIGYAANHDAFTDAGHQILFGQDEVDFIGISAYRWLVAADEVDSIGNVGEVSDDVFDTFVASWTTFLDEVEHAAAQYNLPVVLQEVGAVQQNYAARAPWSVNPGDWVDADAADRYAFDPLEQKAIFESVITALEGRADVFESVTFWTWEHQASRGRRTTDIYGTQDGFEAFAIYPTDGGGGQYLTEYLATVGETEDPFDLDSVFAQFA